MAETGVVAVIRGTRGDRTAEVLEALAGAGILCLEVTMNTPGALAALRAARDSGIPGLELGAGTVVTPDQADAAADAGASFIVAPNTDASVAARVGERGLAYYPGALTPTEVAAAWDLGASAVKVFPASAFGPRYLRDLRGPFRDIPLVPTGGIGIDAAGDYIKAGALAVGIGGPLLGDALDGGDLGALADRARRLLNAVREARC